MWSSESVERDAAQPIFSLCASCVVGFRRPQLDMDDGEDGGYEDDAATEYDNDEGGEESAAADQRAHNPAYEAAVEQLNEAEEQLLAAHIGAVRRTSSARAFALDGGNSLTLLFCVVLFGCVFFFFPRVQLCASFCHCTAGFQCPSVLPLVGSFDAVDQVERNAAMCVEEGALLASILDKSVVDYDIDEYADKLEVWLASLS